MRKLAAVDVIFWAWTISLALLFLIPGKPNLPAYKYGQPASAEYQAGGAGCDPRALATIRNDRQATRERKRCAEATEEHRLKSDDLIQQTRAANAAEVGAVLNYELARMALAGTIGGFLTLIAAAAAAYFARDAALASRETLGAFVAVERPRLILRVVSVWKEGDNITISFKCRNIGKTAAYVSDIRWNKLNSRKPDRPFRLIEKVDKAIPAGEDGPSGHITAAPKGVIPYWVGGYVRYSSPFSNDHRSYFGLSITDRPNNTYNETMATAEDVKGDEWPGDWPEDT